MEPAPLAYIPTPFSSITLITPVFSIEAPFFAPIPIEYAFVAVSDFPTVIFPEFMAFPIFPSTYIPTFPSPFLKSIFPLLTTFPAEYIPKFLPAEPAAEVIFEVLIILLFAPAE